MKPEIRDLTLELFKIPNLLSLFRLLLSLVIPFLWVKKAPNKLIVALIILGALSDTLDGNLARLLKQKSKIGKILDPLADKCFVNMLFFLFYLEGKITLFFFTIILTRDLGILFGAIYLLKKGINLKNLNPTLLGKISTVSQLFCLIILFTANFIKALPYELVKTVLILTLFFTLASGFHYLLLFKRAKTLVQEKNIERF